MDPNPKQSLTSGIRTRSLKRSAPRRRGGTAGRWRWLEIAFPLLVIVWMWFASLGSQTIFIPPMPKIAAAFADTWIFDHVPTDFVPSLGRLSLGLLIGVVLGALFGYLFGLSRTLYRMYSPVVEFCRSLPAPAVLPVLLLVLGVGVQTQVALIAFGTIWPVLIGTQSGVRSIDATNLDTARSLRLGRLDRFFSIIVPGSAPPLFAGMKTSLSIGIILMVISEMVGSANGIGHFVIRAQREFNMPGMWAGIVLLGILGSVLNAIFDRMEKRVLAWYHGSKQRAT
jgi:ABC-type nitrate/sulfonate/bicarbonate transport system permease component